LSSFLSRALYFLESESVFSFKQELDSFQTSNSTKLKRDDAIEIAIFRINKKGVVLNLMDILMKYNPYFCNKIIKRNNKFYLAFSMASNKRDTLSF